MLKKLSIITCLAGLFMSSAFAQQQTEDYDFFLEEEKDQKVNYDIQLQSDEPAVFVSIELFNDIENWLPKGKTIGLYEYLSNSEKISDEELNGFWKLYAEGVASNSTKSKVASGDCNCQSIIPSGSYDYTNRSNSGHLEREKYWNGKHSVWYDYQIEGPAIELNKNAFGNDVSDAYNQVHTGVMKYRILNLCTVLGYISDQCNCNKTIEIDGNFGVTADVNSDANRQWIQNEGAYSAIDASYYGFTAELNSNGSGSPYLSHDEIDTMSILMYMRENHSVDESKLASSAFALFRAIAYATAGKYPLAVKDGITFVKDLRASQTRRTSGQNTTFDREYSYNKFYQLRSNIIREIIFASNVSSLVVGYGPGFDNDLSWQSNFSMGLKISTEYTTYGPLQPTVPIGTSQDCCNESYGTWFLAGNNQVREDDYRSDLDDFFKVDFVNGGPYIWDVAINGVVNGGVLTINQESRKGSVYTTNTCGCEGFLIDIEGQIGILEPKFTLSNETDRNPIELTVINHADFQNVPGATIEIVDAQGNKVASGTGSIYNLNVSAGVYYISFVDPATGCRSTVSFDVKPCPQWTGDEEACLEDALTVYPNPINPNFEILTVEFCFYCDDEELDPAYMQTKFLPGQVKIYDVSGTLVHTTGNVFLGNLDNNDCIKHEIDLTQLSGFPFASGTQWMVIVELSGGLTLSRTVIIN